MSDRSAIGSRGEPTSDPVPLEDKVRFLERPDAYPDHPERVEARETHLSWVFLTPEWVYKLKKPVRDALRDFSTPEGRRANCEREVELNRPLAPGVYQGVVALGRDPGGRLCLGGEGEPVDWLVHMRRLPEHRMLDHAIEEGTARDAGLLVVARRLVEFYERAERAPWTPEEYRERLAHDIEADRGELARFDLPADAVAEAQQRFARAQAARLDHRVREGRVVEAHGDLRPEHVCLADEPVIIDRLEFARDLRLLDTASELAFLDLECDRLGAPWVGALFRRTYVELTGDAPPDPLWEFYRSRHACTRAKLALWHLDDAHVRKPDKWRARAQHYLRLASAFCDLVLPDVRSGSA